MGFIGFACTNENFPDLPRRIDRLNLATGKVTNWYSVGAGHDVHVAAVDLAGRPIIVVDQYHVFRLIGPNQAQPMFNSPVRIWDRQLMQVDSHGLWFTVPDIIDSGIYPSSVWFYSDTAGLHRLQTGQTIVAIEGACR